MKCSDIPDRPILEFLAKHLGKWCTWGPPPDGIRVPPAVPPTVQDAMPYGTPGKLQLAKMRQLKRRGLVSGCPCGCRGDFEITQKGLAFQGLPCSASWVDWAMKAGPAQFRLAQADRKLPHPTTDSLDRQDGQPDAFLRPFDIIWLDSYMQSVEN